MHRKIPALLQSPLLLRQHITSHIRIPSTKLHHQRTFRSGILVSHEQNGTTTTATSSAPSERNAEDKTPLPYPYDRFDQWIPDDLREHLVKRVSTVRRTQHAELNDQNFRNTTKQMVDVYTNQLPYYVRLASVKHPGTALQEQTAAAKESIAEVMRQVNDRLAQMKEQFKISRVDDLVALVSSEQSKRKAENHASASLEVKAGILDNLTNYGQLFAQLIMSQYVDEIVKNPTAKLRYSEMVIDKIIARIDNEQFLMTAGNMFGDMGEHTLGIKVFKRLRDLEPDNVVNLYNLAMQYEAKGMYEHAISSFKKLHDEAKLPNRITLLKLSKCHERVGDFHDAAHYHKMYAQELLDTLKETDDKSAGITVSGQSRGINEQESVEVLLDLGYLHTMAEEFDQANETFLMTLNLFPHHSIIAYQWLVAMRNQQRYAKKLQMELQDRENAKENNDSVLLSSAEAKKLEERIEVINTSITQALQEVKTSVTNLQEISVVNKALVDLCNLQIGIMEKQSTKECWKHVVEACNHASTRDNQELVIFEATNFLYMRKYGGEFDDFKSSYNAFLLQYISQQSPIFTDNSNLWSRLRKLTGKSCSVSDARSLLLVLKIVDNETEDITFRKYHLIAQRDNEERQVQFAVDFEALIQKEIATKEIVIHECQATLALDENVTLEIGSSSEVYTGIFNVGPLLEEDCETAVAVDELAMRQQQQQEQKRQ